ncbi:MAG TPA: response regulator transcription factor [Flavobacteriales bacterium]|nr:response regulator transcription factor [Flavobacteriales bacterium]HMZ49003.1 response regulator transcription factor [Flavobacteriales bacterium]HNE79991.1 response regulator transcription factor [Flavobacteriales bacterium]HNI04078.1 response regulator transcription factor [Flavobacteriales bacterium]HNK40913.1 response regulator transcription factor [Flavobacteriales bacterium]
MESVRNKVTILLVDDQSIILDGIQAIMELEPDLQVVGRATNGPDALDRVRALEPDIVLMDINMPGMDGLEVTRAVLKADPATRVLVLSSYGNKEFVLELLDVGARGYLLKTSSKDELIGALRTVASGGRYIARELRALIEPGDRYKDRQGEDGYSVLTKREVEVVKLILQERTNQEIAAALFISPPTVETHRKNIMHKLDVRNTAGLVKYAMQRGWDLKS